MITIKQEYLDSLKNGQHLLARFILYLIKEKGIDPERDHRNVDYILQNYNVRPKLDEIAEQMREENHV